MTSISRKFWVYTKRRAIERERDRRSLNVGRLFGVAAHVGVIEEANAGRVRRTERRHQNQMLRRIVLQQNDLDIKKRIRCIREKYHSLTLSSIPKSGNGGSVFAHSTISSRVVRDISFSSSTVHGRDGCTNGDPPCNSELRNRIELSRTH